MSATLEILGPGAHTTVQDLGRPGLLAIGVPPSGALDPIALRLANRLVGNEEGEAALEVLHAGPEFTVRADSARIALVGNGSGLEVLEPEPARIPSGRSVTLPRDARVRVAPLRGSACVYLSVAGGFDIAPSMGSRSTYGRGGFGGFQGRAIEAGDRLPLAWEIASRGPALVLGKPLADTNDDPCRIRAVLGPQDDRFTAAGVATFLGNTFTVSRSFDRMGARLDGPTLELGDFESFISDGIAAGAIQVPGSGQPIVLLADHQTSGGYPKIATVISADLPLLGRLRPGSRLRFAAVSVDAAEAARRVQAREVEALMRAIEPAADEPRFDLRQLYAGNLISGVVNGSDPIL